MSSNRLYYRKTGFLLSDSITIFQIEEPIKWDQVKLCIKFDESTLGYRYEFSDKDVVLEFDEAAGYSKIKAQYEAKRVDLNCSLKFGFYEDDIFNVLYEGQLVGETYSDNGITIKATIEKRSIGQKFKSRFDMRADLFRPDSIDGILITPLQTVDMVMHGADLKQSASGIYNTNVDPVMNLVLEQASVGINPPEFHVAVPPYSINGNIQSVSDPIPPDGSFYYAGLTLNPGETRRRIKVTLRMDFKYDKTNSGQPIASGFWIFKVPGISTGNTGDLGEIVSEGQYINYTTDDGTVGGTFHTSRTGTFIFDVFADEALFIKAVIYVANPDGAEPFTISNFEFENLDLMYINIQETVSSESTVNKWAKLFEAVNKQCEIITDNQNILKSNVLGRTDLGYAEDGELAGKFVANGKLVRNAPTTPFNWSAKDWVTSLSNLYALGLTIEKDVNNKEWVRVEPVEFFFGNDELLKFTDISKYEKIPALEYIFNELEFGFSKYPQDNQLDSLKDYLTKMLYSTPIKYYKNKMSKIIDFLLSTYYTEYTRQQSFATNPSNAYETDENTFLLQATATLNKYINVDCSFQPDKVIYLRSEFGSILLPIVKGDEIAIEDHSLPENNKTYNVVSVYIIYNDNGLGYQMFITVVESFTEDLGTEAITLDVVSGRYAPTTNLFFEGGASAYNPDYTITKTLDKWSKIFTSGLSPYFGSGTIKFLSGFNNIDIDNINHAIPDFNNGEESNLTKPLFSGNIISFETLINWNIFKTIIAAFEGRDPDDKNYGYITCLNPDNIEESGYIMDLSFDPNKQLLKVELLERYKYA